VTRSLSTTNPRRHYDTPSVNDDEKEDLMDTDDAPPIRFRRHTTIAMDEKPDSDSDSDEREDPDAARAVIPAAYFPPSDFEAWDANQLRVLQLADKFCSETMAAIQESGVTWGTIHKPRVPGPVPRADNTKSIFIINNEALLCHRANGGPPCVVVPEALKAFILRNHHGVPFVGHCGANKVLGHMRKRYWWRGMARDVRRWIKACLFCKRRKTPRPLHAGQARSNPISPHPWHTVAIDLVGPLNTTVTGFKYMLTIVDTFTRWFIAVPIQSKKADVVADAIYRHLLTKQGCPATIFSDQGGEYVNAGLKSMCRHWGIRKLETTGWQPQANPVERAHRWLNTALTALL
jgi:hypothetical protein